MAERPVFEGRDITSEVKNLVDNKSEPKKPKEVKVVAHGKRKQDSIPVRFFKELVPNGDVPLGQYLWSQVLIPTARRAILDTIHMLLGVSSGPTDPKQRYASRVDYTQYSKINQPKKRPFNSGYQPVIVESRQEAQDILEQMQNILDNYDVVAVADLYQMAGIPIVSIDNKYGWASIVGSRVEFNGNGFLIRLPDPEPL